MWIFRLFIKSALKAIDIIVLFFSLSLLFIAAAQSLVQLLTEAVDEDVMSQFVQNFLLESNSTAVRWQAHELLYSIYKYVYHLFKFLN